VADETVQYRLEVTGADAVARAYASIDKEIAKNTLSQDKFDKIFASSTKRHIDLINKDAINALVKQRLGIEGVSKSTTSLRANIDQLARATESQAAQTRQFAQGMGRLAPSFAAFGNQIRVIAPDLAQYTGALGRTGGAIAGITSVISGGAGIVAGGAIAVLGVFATAMEDARVRSEELAKAERDRAKAHQDASNAVLESNKALFVQVRTSANIQKDLDASAARLSEIGKRKEFGAVKGLGVEIGAGELHTGNMNELAKEQQTRAGLFEELEAAKEREKNDKNKKKNNPGARAHETFEQRHQRNLDNVQAGMEASQRRDSELAGFQAQLNAGPSAETVAAREKEKADKAVIRSRLDAHMQALELDKKERETAVENYKHQADEYEKIDESTTRRWDDMRKAGVSVFETFGAAGLKSLQALAKGQKVSGKAVIGAIGDQLFAEGTMYLLKGIAETISLNPQGPAHMAIGGVMVATGLGMGAVGSGGGAGAGAARGRGATPIAPSRDSGSDFTRPRNVGSERHYHFHSTVPSTTEQSRELMRTIERGERDGVYPRLQRA